MTIKVRICLDPKDLNNAIQREHYPMQTIDEVISRTPNAKVFQRTMNQILRAHLEGVEVIMDDILVWGVNAEQSGYS